MADVGVPNPESEEAVLLRHKKERKELQSKVTALKKACAKGDKKKKKEVAEEIATIEADLDRKQELELQQIPSSQVTQVEDVEPSVQQASACVASLVLADSDGPRQTKAQRRRDKKAGQEKEREERIAQQAEENKKGPRHLEEVAIKQLLTERGLRLHQVPSDGNCLYFAVAHQLSQLGETASASSLRGLAANYLRAHEDDFRPFTSSPEGGELSSEEFAAYCSKVEGDSAEWGGQLELQALSAALRRPLEVLQAEGPPVLLGELHRPRAALTITFHRHAFGLGEHYNSATPL